jgi:hypothetical protein
MGIFTGLIAGAKALVGVSNQSEGTSKVMDMAVGVGRWIDEQQYTEEERAIAHAKLGEQVIAFVGATANENTTRSVTRRSIAIWIMRAEIITIAVSAAVFPITGFKEWSEYLFKLASTDSPLGWMAMGVAVFFFGTHMLRSTKMGNGK